jgi:hypothetical protein
MHFPHWRLEIPDGVALRYSEGVPKSPRCTVVWRGRIHDFLMALGESLFRKQGIQVNVDGKDVAELSDGLEGEPHGAQGWIARFSKHPFVEG